MTVHMRLSVLPLILYTGHFHYIIETEIIFHIVAVSVEINSTYSMHCFHANNDRHTGPDRPGTSTSTSSNSVQTKAVAQGKLCWNFTRFTQMPSGVDLAYVE